METVCVEIAKLTQLPPVEVGFHSALNETQNGSKGLIISPSKAGRTVAFFATVSFLTFWSNEGQIP